MIVVSDASVVINLNRIGRLGLLRDIYGRVVVPEAVWKEVGHDAPGLLESEASWMEVRAVSSRGLVVELAEDLDPEESERLRWRLKCERTSSSSTKISAGQWLCASA